jgi:hypothetical protein
MMIRNLSLALALAAFSLPAFAAGGGTASTSPDAQSVDQACSAEAQTAGCSGEQVGTGLMKCIHAYKKANRKAFQISAGCKAAMQKEGQDIRAKKAAGQH